MIAFHYPPEMSSSGVLRTLKFSKYLPEFGWQPTILTVDPKYYEAPQMKLMEQIPSAVSVCRTRAIDMKKTFSVKGKYLRAWTTPDRFIGWLPFAVHAGLKFIKREKIDMIFSTSPLATSHLIAYTLKKLTKLPWVADFRDPWTEPELEADRDAFRFRLQMRLERAVVSRADRLVFTTGYLRDYVLGHHDSRLSAKAVVIPNGYDEEDFGAPPQSAPPAGPIRILHTGLVDQHYRSPMSLFQAIADLVRAGELDHRAITIDFGGGGAYLESSEFKESISKLGLSEQVRVLGRMGYQECLDEQRRSDWLLLLQCGDDTRTLIPAKAFEYLRVARPILAITPAGATSELFARVGGAVVVHPGDKTGMEDAVRRIVRHDCSLAVCPDELRKFERKNLTEQLARAFTTVRPGILELQTADEQPERKGLQPVP
jgi:glycosyltransferase involved in cell wall biosynthesis